MPKLLEYIIDGENEDGQMSSDGQNAPFAIFCPELQCNVGGPYAERAHAEAALELIEKGVMMGYSSGFGSGSRLTRDFERRRKLNGLPPVD